MNLYIIAKGIEQRNETRKSILSRWHFEFFQERKSLYQRYPVADPDIHK